MRTQQNIMHVVKNDLCMGCGTCIAVCPVDALRLVKDESRGTYLPIPMDNCTYCGLCVKACPGLGVDFISLSKSIFNEAKSNSVLLGRYTNTYVAYTTDQKMRFFSSSGGLVTQILVYLLETKKIDAALVVRMRKDKPLEAEPRIVMTKEEIIEAQGSKYCPVPVNAVLKSLVKSRNRRLAVVGLPCQIHGLRMVENLIKRVAEAIYIRIGIFCNNTPSFWATKYILNRLHIDEDEIESLSYRGCGWPGYLKIKLKKRRNPILLPFFRYWNSGFGQFFCNMRCRLCIDQSNELADISLGDAWIPEFMTQNSLGFSLVITRSKLAEEILKEMRNNGLIRLTRVEPNKAIQDAAILKKAGYKLWASSRDSSKIPKYKAEVANLRFKVIAYCLIFKGGSFLARYSKLWALLDAYAKIINHGMTLLGALKLLTCKLRRYIILNS